MILTNDTLLYAVAFHSPKDNFIVFSSQIDETFGEYLNRLKSHEKIETMKKMLTLTFEEKDTKSVQFDGVDGSVTTYFGKIENDDEMLIGSFMVKNTSDNL